MPKRARELSALEVGRLKKAGYYSVGGVPGLALKVGDEKTTRSWILRYSVGETRRDMGLGSASEVSLAEARAKAKEARALLRDGRDPLTEAKSPEPTRSPPRPRARRSSIARRRTSRRSRRSGRTPSTHGSGSSR